MSFGPIIMILVLATVATVEIQFVGWLGLMVAVSRQPASI
jgi:hypothetical protein